MKDLKARANFDEDLFDENNIRDWALSDEGGGLPDVSAFAFASWLDTVWNDYDDASGTQTNEDVLRGALAHWTGRS